LLIRFYTKFILSEILVNNQTAEKNPKLVRC